ncbi:MAG: hypothetical protein IJC76_06255 [Lachnospiraceae bacterium]|nr:hypothetical protein [Lachnospiraceae bacterium]
MEDILQESIDKAYRGRESWIKLFEEYGLGNRDYVVLFPAENNTVNPIAIRYINKLAGMADKVLVLAYDNEVLNNSEYQENVTVIRYEREQAEELMQFYSLYQFTDRLIIVSLDEPEGRCGGPLVGVNGITMDEMVAIGIFGFKEA